MENVLLAMVGGFFLGLLVWHALVSYVVKRTLQELVLTFRRQATNGEDRAHTIYFADRVLMRLRADNVWRVCRRVGDDYNDSGP